jgi:hypothetical protein
VHQFFIPSPKSTKIAFFLCREFNDVIFKNYLRESNFVAHVLVREAVDKSIFSRWRPPGRNPALFSSRLDVKRVWVANPFVDVGADCPCAW